MAARWPRDALLARAVEGDEEQLLGVLEGVHERGGVVEVALPDAHTAGGEVLGLAGIADADADAVGGDALQEAFDGAAAELSGGSGNDDHVPCPISVSVESAPWYHWN